MKKWLERYLQWVVINPYTTLVGEAILISTLLCLF